MSRLLLFTITFLSMSQLAGGWDCGGARIDDDSICVCGDTNITYSDSGYPDYTACCGRDTYLLDQDGNGQCPDGQVCKSYSTFRCGDIRIPYNGVCQCGEEKLTEDDYKWSYKWCCPSSSSSCSYEDGNGICINGTVNTGKKARCPSGVTYYGHNRNYKVYVYCEDGEQIDKDQISCYGTKECNDKADLDPCIN